MCPDSADLYQQGYFVGSCRTEGFVNAVLCGLIPRWQHRKGGARTQRINPQKDRQIFALQAGLSGRWNEDGKKKICYGTVSLRTEVTDNEFVFCKYLTRRTIAATRFCVFCNR